MSKPATNLSAALGIASEALDAQHNEGRNVLPLAELAQYLGDDSAGYLDSEGERLRRDLDTAEG